MIDLELGVVACTEKHYFVLMGNVYTNWWVCAVKLNLSHHRGAGAGFVTTQRQRYRRKTRKL
jgi:hypothetical protein